MASISFNSKMTRSPSAANASKPPSGTPPSNRGAASSAISPSNGFDPSSSFFPHALPGSEAPRTSPRRVRSWRKWFWPLAGLLLLAGGSVYFVHQPAQDASTPNSGGPRIPATDAAPSAKAARLGGRVVREGPQPTAQTRVTHTLPGSVSPSQMLPPSRAQEMQSVAGPAEKAATPLPAINATPHVTHTGPIAPPGEPR
jgi:hypothetical protein